MSRQAILMALSVLPIAGLAARAAGGQPSWVSFVDETATRLVADSAVGAANTDEKDYAWGDVDNDGDTDLVVVMKSNSTPGSPRRNALFMNEGGVLVDRTVEYASAATVMLQGDGLSQGFLDLTNDRDVVLADVTGDTWLDVVTSTIAGEAFGKAISHPRVYVNLGDDPPGSGNWQGFVFDDEDRVPTVLAPRFTSISAGDIDGDTDLDLYLTSKDLDAPSPDDVLWINDGQGHFSDETALRLTPEMVDSPSSDAEFADMNGDGALDIVKVKAVLAPTGVRIHYNDPLNHGFFTDSEFVYQASAEFVAAADLNNDTLLDIVITDDGSDRYLLNAANGADGFANFAAAAVLQGSLSAFGSHIVIADLNKDDWLDVAIGSVYFGLPSCSTSAMLYHNLGLEPDEFSLTIASQGNAGIGAADLTGVHDFAVFDINGDTWLDLVIGRCSGTNVYMNQALVPCTGFGDMNADGALDGRDIPGFAECYINQAPACNCADANDDQAITDFDLQRFVFELLTAE